jgi:hypothetical protein
MAWEPWEGFRKGVIGSNFSLERIILVTELHRRTKVEEASVRR